MERLTTRMQHRPAMYTPNTIIIITYYVKPLIVFMIRIHYSIALQLVYIALTTLQIRRLLLDNVESANVCIVRCSIYSCAPGTIECSTGWRIREPCKAELELARTGICDVWAKIELFLFRWSRFGLEATWPIQLFAGQLLHAHLLINLVHYTPDAL